MDVELLDDRGEQCAMKKSQNVVMKGTKDGLTLHLNDRCSYEELLEELQEKYCWIIKTTIHRLSP